MYVDQTTQNNGFLPLVCIPNPTPFPSATHCTHMYTHIQIIGVARWVGGGVGGGKLFGGSASLHGPSAHLRVFVFPVGGARLIS